MEKRETEGKNERVFSAFPFEPYPIQIDFMNALYESLDKGGVAMLESPTGTGKTLSIICSALQWLVDQKQKQQNRADNFFEVASNLNGKSMEQSGIDNEPDWMRDFVVKKQVEPVDNKTNGRHKSGVGIKKIDRVEVRDFGGKCANIEEHEEREVDGKLLSSAKTKVGIKEEEEQDEDFLLDEYESDEGTGGQMKRRNKGASICSSSEDDDEEISGWSDEEDETGLKVYFCSRTHSQLSQFIKELRRTRFASELKIVSLGSRKNLCINKEVLKLGIANRINEKCLELQKSKIKTSKSKNLGGGRRRRMKASSGCPMLRRQKLQRDFQIEIYEHGPMDIEDLILAGNELGTCPYYGSRNVVPVADLVVLPYHSLLSKSSREALGIRLKDNVVIIDEAHNLADSLISMYNATISLSQIQAVHLNLERYFHRFDNLLGPANRRYIQTLMVLTRTFLQIFTCDNDATNAEEAENIESSFAINEFLFWTNVDNINLIKLIRYIEDSKVMHKVSGYADKQAISQDFPPSCDSGESTNLQESILSSFQSLISVLRSLTYKNGDGRIILSRTRHAESGQLVGHLKYVMLTGEKIFSEIVEQAHAVILAGGTLQPIDETKQRLFPCLPPDRFHIFSCDHIIPPENLLPIAVHKGPSGQSFDFSYNVRGSSLMVEELGSLLCNLVTVVPEGVVVFFSSFDYESQVYNSWKETGILERIAKKKRVFREPRKSAEVEPLLKEYKETISAISGSKIEHDRSSCNGAILFAIVGGKVSEGINFSDGMGRCIVMVGLPYPSPSDIELIERLKHIEGLQNVSPSKELGQLNKLQKRESTAGFYILRSCKHRGKQYYENLCMKAVNQSIGRAIRHVNDYAAILLVDARYASDPSKRSFAKPTDKLPRWIKDRLVSTTQNYGELQRLLHQFFKFHKLKHSNK